MILAVGHSNDFIFGERGTKFVEDSLVKHGPVFNFRCFVHCLHIVVHLDDPFILAVQVVLDNQSNLTAIGKVPHNVLLWLRLRHLVNPRVNHLKLFIVQLRNGTFRCI